MVQNSLLGQEEIGCCCDCVRWEGGEKERGRSGECGVAASEGLVQSFGSSLLEYD